MRWLALWLLLTGIYLLILLIAQPLAGGGWTFTRETAAHLLAVPLAQVGALWLVVWLRKALRSRGRSSPE